jgi:predicted SnoaL-like aldol condensation-catalyzing enzyme
VKFTKLLPPLAAILALSTGVANAADTAANATEAHDNMVGLSTPNGKLAYDFINLWFNEHKPGEAFDKYVSHDHYMNHALASASVNEKKTFEQEKQAEISHVLPATTHFEIMQLISQGSLVFAHIRVTHGAGNPESELVTILRVRGGKVTDHWYVRETLKPDSAVFAGLDR